MVDPPQALSPCRARAPDWAAPELWGTAPLVKGGSMLISAASLATPRRAHFVATVRGRVLHASPSLACFDAVRPYLEVGSDRAMRPGGVWGDEGLGLGGPVPALVAALAALCKGTLVAGEEDLSQLLGRAGGEESPESASHAGRATGSDPPSPTSGSSASADPAPNERRRDFLVDAHRVAQRLKHIAEQHEEPGASSLPPTASARLTVYPQIQAGSPPLPVRTTHHASLPLLLPALTHLDRGRPE